MRSKIKIAWVDGKFHDATHDTPIGDMYDVITYVNYYRVKVQNDHELAFTEQFWYSSYEEDSIEDYM